MTVSEKVSYIQGLFDGMGLDKAESKEAKILSEVLDVLREVGEELEALDASVDELGEELDAVSDDLSDVEAVVFEEDDGEDGCCCGHEGHEHPHEHLPEHEIDGFEHIFDGPNTPIDADCPNCGQKLLIGEDSLEAGFISCPACGQKFALSLDDEQGEDV